MAASFPTAVKNFSAVVNGVTKLVASLFNSPYDEITAIETALGANMSNIRMGAWVDKSSSYGAQQAATDGFVVVWLVSSLASGFTDGNADPTTKRCAAEATNGNSFTMPVKKNDYWKVVLDSGLTITVYWIPLGG